MYVQNLIHKCESIFMDLLEYYSLDKNLTAEEDTQVNNRMKRIYGQSHKSVFKAKETEESEVNLLGLGGIGSMMKAEIVKVSEEEERDFLNEIKTAHQNKKQRW